MSGTPAKFPKSAHLLKHADFKRVYEKGKRHFSSNLTAFFLQRASAAGEERSPDTSGQVRVGFTVGRVLGGSVERNRIRRRTREAVRLHMAALQDKSVDVILHPKKSVLKLDFALLSDEVARAFAVIRQRTSPAKEGRSA